MKVSVITPTSDREPLLQGTYTLLKNQCHADWEWLIYDTSLRPAHFSDPRITYIHDEGIVTIGEKRNRLIQKATGDCIVHFDDDDFYGPTYLESTVKRLQKAPVFTLKSWFSYDIKTHQFYYWDTEEIGEVRYRINAISGTRINEIELRSIYQEELNKRGSLGYGFSYAYMKEVATSCSFKDIDFSEDRYFYDDAEKAGFLFATEAEERAEVIHVIHDSNTSTEFPQYRIPRFLARTLAPSFFPYLELAHAKN